MTTTRRIPRSPPRCLYWPTKDVPFSRWDHAKRVGGGT